MNEQVALHVSDTPSKEERQLQAAYALNLCAVSVSQIIDYNDITVLEQEYEAILNNLNLENMPKDEALLDILKQLLDTITFFRIQEGDKYIVEKEYQQKMKNAIWAAVPNLGLLVAGGNPLTMAISLASQVGIGYMNYRKNRAEYQLEHEKQQWQLQRTAIEQFQALRQQLFETSWRLADEYGFPDSYRLTERQIRQYNNILMDEDDIRKYERLNTIKDRFAAYPPFWYYLGNTANSVANNVHNGLDDAGRKEYRKKAVEYFSYYQHVSKHNLLREDNITAACNLEYADLLDVNSDKEKIKILIDGATNAAGSSFDVLQLCSIGYIRIGCMSEAANILLQLVNEGYNAITNAQLLSSIYVSKYISTRQVQFSSAYLLLQDRVDRRYLFPMPINTDEYSETELKQQFIAEQRTILLTKYKLVLTNFIEKYEQKVNQVIPLPASDEELPAGIYDSAPKAREERIRRVKLVAGDSIRSEAYKSELSNISYSVALLDILNHMFDSLCRLECIQDERKQLELTDLVKEALQKNKNTIISVSEGLHGDPSNTTETSIVSAYVSAQRITLGELARELFIAIAKEINSSVKKKTEMNDFAIAELSLIRFCESEDLPEPEVLYIHKDDPDTRDVEKTRFTPELIGDSAVKENKRIKMNATMLQCIKDKIGAVSTNSSIEFYPQDDIRVSRYFQTNKFLASNSSRIRPKTLAVLDDRTYRDMDLLFTTQGVMPVIHGKVKAPITYKSIKWSNNSHKKELLLGDVKYFNKFLDMDMLYALIQELGKNAEGADRTSY